MKNLFKRIITTILVLTMVMGFNVPFSATTVMAASITYNVSSTIKGVLTDDGVLTISGTGAMPDYTKIANIPWYKDRDRISEVRVNSGITSIGEANFNSCYNMTKVAVASTVTSIGDGAFADTKLQSYTGMERVKTFGDYVFQGTDLDDFSEEELINLDAKKFEENGVKCVIAQVNTVSIEDVLKRKEKLEEAINNEIEKDNLNLFVFAITDILNSNSQIIALGNRTDIIEKSYKLEDNMAFLEGVVSRKKQILPMVEKNI